MQGLPYTKDRLVMIMDRVRERAGIGVKGGEQIVLYSNRHTFGTEAAGRITDIELAELMGHTTTHTTKRYVHLNAERLREIRKRAEG
jgi:site-specific recombinase XerD